jgi:hypothetical protein
MKNLKYIIEAFFVSILPIVMIIVTLVKCYGEKLAIYPQVKENYGFIMVALFLGSLLELFGVVDDE